MCGSYTYVGIHPKLSVSSFMGYLRGKSLLMIYDRHTNLKYKHGNRHFWAKGYFVSTVGLNKATIVKYIREQEDEDKMSDNMATKEYKDSFKRVRELNVVNGINRCLGICW